VDNINVMFCNKGPENAGATDLKGQIAQEPFPASAVAMYVDVGWEKGGIILT
jgi:hypothetical protein